KIPIAAKICSVADAFDAMTSNRPYRKGINPLQAANIFEQELGSGQWEPDIVNTFIKLVRASYKEK
ncbi:MAG TPA: HD domain-containing phosphohydrolase, partial [bacterium]|nr:HD domain-containing phosphohydrolase [bacterium]